MSEVKQKDPSEGFYRLKAIIGDPRSNPPTPAIIPVCKSSWWAGVKSGRFPEGVKLGPNTTAWVKAEIEALCIKLAKDKMEKRKAGK